MQFANVKNDTATVTALKVHWFTSCGTGSAQWGSQ
jgi:hypothetical protein